LKSNRNEQSNDQMAAIGIGAMIVFIALILVAAVAAAVIIQTAEKLQQNAQTAGDDTADNMAGKVLINSAFVDTAAAGDSYLLFVTMAPGSEPTPEASVTFQIFCDSGSVEGAAAEMTWLQMSGAGVGGAGLQPGTPYQVVLDASGDDDCSPDNLGTNPEATLFLHVASGGSTYENMVVDDDSAGAVVV
jgi:flagellin FlaB